MDFFDAEQTGTNVPKKCRKCLNCPQCSFQADGLTIKEAQDLEEMKKGASYDPEVKRVKISYVYTE